MNFINRAVELNKVKELYQVDSVSFEDSKYLQNFELYITNKMFLLNYSLYNQIDFSQINEKSTKYNSYCIGDIVFVCNYKYPNGKYGRNHMFLIVDFKRCHSFTIYFGMLISSKTQKISFNKNKYIKKDNFNNLKMDSIIKTDVIYKIFTKNILIKIGKIDTNNVELFKSNLLKCC